MPLLRPPTVPRHVTLHKALHSAHVLKFGRQPRQLRQLLVHYSNLRGKFVPMDVLRKIAPDEAYKSAHPTPVRGSRCQLTISSFLKTVRLLHRGVCPHLIHQLSGRSGVQHQRQFLPWLLGSWSSRRARRSGRREVEDNSSTGSKTNRQTQGTAAHTIQKTAGSPQQFRRLLAAGGRAGSSSALAIMPYGRSAKWG